MAKNKLVTEAFTWDGFLDFCENTPSGKKWKESGENTSEKDDPDSWVYKQTKCTYQEAVEVSRYGWPEGMEQVRDMEGVIASHMTAHEHAVIGSDVYGFMPNVPAYLAGTPDTMLNMTQTEHNMPIVKIVAHPVANATVSQNHFTEYGIAIMCLVNTIEQQGLSCEVDLSFLSHGRGIDTNLIIEVKKAGQPLDTDRLIFALAHPAMFRRFKFRWTEQDRFFGSHNMGHGHPQKETPESTHEVFNVPCMEQVYSKYPDLESKINYIESTWNAYQEEYAI